MRYIKSSFSADDCARKKCAKWNHNKISDADWLSSRLPFQESDLDTTIPHLVWLIWRQLNSIYVRTYCNTIIINELNLFINFFDTFDFERGKILYVHFEFGHQKISMHRGNILQHCKCNIYFLNDWFFVGNSFLSSKKIQKHHEISSKKW